MNSLPAIAGRDDDALSDGAGERALAASDREKHPFRGRHLLASYSGCDPAALRDTSRLTAVLCAAVEAAGATIVRCATHLFDGGGLTAVLLLLESHASLHTYPEHGSCFVDLFTCGLHCREELFDAHLRAYLQPQSVSSRILARN